MRFSVLTYNVLHSFGAQRLLRSRPGVWSIDRLQRAAEMVQRLQPDLACLQEFDQAAEEAFLRNLEGYRCVAVLRNEQLPPKDGCAIFARARVAVADSHSFRVRDVVERHFPAALELRRTAGLSAALWRELHEKLTLAVAVDLDCEDGRKLRVATSHLYWDPRFPDLKLLQAFLLDQELSDFTGGLILAGDLNSTPLLDGRSSGEGVLSGVYQLLTQGDVEVLHPHHPVQMRPKVGILKGLQPQDVPEFRISPYRSAAVEARGAEAATNASADFVGCLDYILYKGPQLRLVGATWPDAATLPGGVLPSEEQPSDHLPLLAVFELGDEQGPASDAAKSRV